MESWTHMGRTANIIIKDVIHVFASICKIMHILLMGRRNREGWLIYSSQMPSYKFTIAYWNYFIHITCKKWLHKIITHARQCYLCYFPVLLEVGFPYQPCKGFTPSVKYINIYAKPKCITIQIYKKYQCKNIKYSMTIIPLITIIYDNISIIILTVIDQLDEFRVVINESIGGEFFLCRDLTQDWNGSLANLELTAFIKMQPQENGKSKWKSNFPYPGRFNFQLLKLETRPMFLWLS